MAEYPQKIRPFQFLGLGLTRSSGTEWKRICPFCDKPKFSVSESTGQWRCWSCATGSKSGGGNISSFLRLFHDLCFDETSVSDYNTLSSERGYLDSQVLIEWGWCKSVYSGDWMIPGYNAQRIMVSLYRRIKQQDGSYRLIPTPTLGHHLHGMNLWDDRKPIVYLCEGPWDAMILHETMSKAKNGDSGLMHTASRESSLYAQTNIIATPGCEVFFEPWIPLLKNKTVNIMFDSDHPRKTKNGIVPGGGWRGSNRIANLLMESRTPPQEVNILTWGEEGYDPSYKSGFDVRDYILTV